MEQTKPITARVTAQADMTALDDAMQKANALVQKIKEANTLAGELASMVRKIDVNVTVT